LERRAHLVEPRDDRPTVRRRWEVLVIGLEPGLTRRRGTGTVALVQDDDAAVLEVVDPAVRVDLVVRSVDPGGDRAERRLVDVRPGRRGAVRVGHLLVDRDMPGGH